MTTKSSNLRTTRINVGIYDVYDRVSGRTFEIERYPDGAWLLFERCPISDDLVGGREYIGDYATLSSAKAAIEDC